jgi:hypothetical protein
MITVCIERTIGLEIIWAHSMEVLGAMAYVESRFGLLRDGVSVKVR